MHPYFNIPELSGTGLDDGVVRVPVEQDIPFSRRVRAIVDTAEFQRLRQVTQLALTSRVYPGAIHNRFEHALGVYHNALQYLWQLGKDPRFADVVSPHEAEVLIAAALLHDIGHWPFCHPIEDLDLEEMPPHEVFAAEFLGPDNELSNVLRRDWKIEPEEVIEVLTGKSSNSSLKLRQSILSGPIDIDKMDYLNRDSQHCGVPYGRNFDRQRLISSLVPNEAADGLAITSKGKTAAEMMVFARYVMFSEVYWHHAVRSATTMFARAFYEVRSSLDLADVFRMTEPDMIVAICTAAVGQPAQSLTDGLFGAHRRLHKRLAEYSLHQRPDLFHALRQMPYRQLVRCSNHLATAVGDRLGMSVRPVDLLIDAPPLHREVEFKVDIFYPHENVYRPLRSVSPIVEAMSNTTFDDCVKRVRICVAGGVMSVATTVPVDEIDNLVAESISLCASHS
ncbi:HD domain-containing protein [Fuerstiella marisgermanici]|uniref:Putative dGTPase n=1 Tax=Fuerstiella marisgermanici TaxID=1891926 RepID=A0A1P8WRV8_9PLAN|nr:HD domain-containing protein [Fuerstiella marisgermanici]APZ96787.1 putative dGTPase [Fuerstiella marisgermanici]